MRTENYKCDAPGCSHVKGEANHWWMAVKLLGSLTIKPWSDSGAAGNGVIHLCGEACAQRKLGEFLSDANRRSGGAESVSGMHPSPDNSRTLPTGVVIEGDTGDGLLEANEIAAASQSESSRGRLRETPELQ